MRDPRNIILIAGFQAENTLGRRLVEHVSPVRIFGQEFVVRARVHTINALRAHADRGGLMRWFYAVKGNLSRAFAVHGESTQVDAMVGLLKDHGARQADAPAPGAFMTWRERLAWVADDEAGPAAGGLRLVCYPEGCLYRRAMLGALQREGRPFSVVYVSPSLQGIESAVATGFGVTVLAERLAPEKLARVRAGLPGLADVTVGVYLNARSETGFAKSFAARIADLMMQPHERR